MDERVQELIAIAGAERQRIHEGAEAQAQRDHDYLQGLEAEEARRQDHGRRASSPLEIFLGYSAAALGVLEDNDVQPDLYTKIDRSFYARNAYIVDEMPYGVLLSTNGRLFQDTRFVHKWRFFRYFTSRIISNTHRGTPALREVEMCSPEDVERGKLLLGRLLVRNGVTQG